VFENFVVDGKEMTTSGVRYIERIEKDDGEEEPRAEKCTQWAVWHVGGPEIILSPGQGFTMNSLGNTWRPEGRVGQD
jgi:hypothetical protein